jgi:hypothetical protein
MSKAGWGWTDYFILKWEDDEYGRKILLCYVQSYNHSKQFN